MTDCVLYLNCVLINNLHKLFLSGMSTYKYVYMCTYTHTHTHTNTTFLHTLVWLSKAGVLFTHFHCKWIELEHLKTKCSESMTTIDTIIPKSELIINYTIMYYVSSLVIPVIRAVILVMVQAETTVYHVLMNMAIILLVINVLYVVHRVYSMSAVHVVNLQVSIQTSSTL